MEKLFLIKKEENIVGKAIKQLIENIKREKILTISSVVVMTLTFLILSAFIFVVVWSQTALRYLEQQVQVSVFFKDDFQESNILALKARYEQDTRISSVKYVSKEDAFKIFSEINKDEPVLLESISPSILPASLEIKTYDIAQLSPLADELSKVDGVEEVRYFRDVVERFRFWSSAVYILGFTLVVLFLFISYSVVIFTTRALITSKGTELEILKLVGASDKYVRDPLIFQGVFFGLTSALIVSLITIIAGAVLNSHLAFRNGFTFGFFPTVFISPLIFSLCVSCLITLSGFLLGLLGSSTAVKNYLKY